MNLYHEEKAFLQAFKEKVLANQEMTKEELLEVAEKFEDMVEMTTVTVKIIDRLMQNYDKLKQQIPTDMADARRH
ncbi:hypothetical protein [Marinoscillum furvescens]|uniref:Uncharacterized protein n=1 Tax=Marinoscillum furvescens DSM 4134 TaxID=1122208 RepID=A0A3D9L0Z0_MARFU|nr:hypothetical protein [Marinoscillum furvescens]RED96191.1 hypothetical protein C7460_11582 [Marinoscillum furvescens DSM 4134]